MADDTVRDKSGYVTTYTPSLLSSISRAKQRESLGIMADALPFRGMDVWNAYEFSWLNKNGKPETAAARFEVPGKSTHIIESKSLKMYLGSYSQTPFANRGEVISTLEADLSLAAQGPVSVTLMAPEHVVHDGVALLPGTNLDSLDISVNEYYWHPDYLMVGSDTIVRESLNSHLFRSLCPMTGQPDTASILIEYAGRSISHEGLLKYLISYREHAEFAEQITERIFVDIMNRCEPDRLTVHGRFTRRGGIDINALRSHEDILAPPARLWRQ